MINNISLGFGAGLSPSSSAVPLGSSINQVSQNFPVDTPDIYSSNRRSSFDYLGTREFGGALNSYHKEFSTNPMVGLAKSYDKQASLEGEIDGISSYIAAKAEIDKSLLAYNAANPGSPVNSFRELMSREGSESYLKSIHEKTGLAPEELMKASELNKEEMVLRAAKINEQLAWQFQIQNTKTQLITAWLKSMEDDNKLSQSSASTA
jgi:hypothetical protein